MGRGKRLTRKEKQAKKKQQIIVGPIVEGDEVIFGLDVGSDTAKIAILAKGETNVNVLANAAGNRATPMTISDAETLMCGEEATKNSYRNLKTTIHRPLLTFKFLENPEDLTPSYWLSPKGGPKVKTKENKVIYTYRYFVEDYDHPEKEPELVEKEISPQEAITTILSRKLKDVAESAAPHCPHGIVITIPSTASKKFVSALGIAITNAKFIIRQVIRSSAAVALAYDLDKPLDDNELIPSKSLQELALVLDVGFIETRATVLRIHGGLVEVVLTKSSEVGVALIHEAIVKYFVKDFERRNKFSPEDNSKAMEKLRHYCWRLLPVLSRSKETMIDIDGLCDGVDYHQKLSRARMEISAGSLFNQILGVGLETVKDAGFEVSDIKHLLHSGGGMHIPRLKINIKNQFPQAKHHDSLDPTFAATIGAARQAHLITKQKDLAFFPVEIN